MVLWLLPAKSWGQSLPDVEALLEMNDVGGEEEGYEDVVETLVYLAAHPLDLNTAGFDSLKMIYFLSDSQIDNILAFRERHGGFRHVNELLLVPGIGATDLANARWFVRVGKEGSGTDGTGGVEQEIIARAKTSRPLQEGYTRYRPEAFITDEGFEEKRRNRFQGPPWGVLVKYKAAKVSGWQAAVTLENFAGEPYGERWTGVDFLSGHVAWMPRRGAVKQVTAGDFKLQWGQGLVAWGGYSAGKSGTLNNEKSGRGIMPYSSTDENNFFRGLGITLRGGRWLEVDALVSYKKVDGNVTEDGEGRPMATLQTTGYHRNELEQEKRRRVEEFATGLAARVSTEAFRAGVQVLHYHFSPSLRTDSTGYRQFYDDGQRRTVASIEYKTAYRSFYLFGETAVADNGAVATVNGLRFSGLWFLTPTVVYRRYDKRYACHYSGGFGEYGNTGNEEGVYVGVEIPLGERVRVTGYYDWFHYFSPRYRATRPGNGQEMKVEATYSRPRAEYRLYFKRERKPEDQKVDGQTVTVARMKEEYRAQWHAYPGNRWELRTRAALSIYDKDTVSEKGFLVYQDVIYTAGDGSLKGQFRLAYFDTPSYNSRLYAHEHNVLYGFSFPAYYDRGIRSYLNLRWKPTRWLTLYGKAGCTYYPDRTTISSYLTRVDDNKLFDFTVQLRIRL